MRRLLSVVVLLSMVWPCFAIDPEQFDDPVLQARYERLSNELRCLKCQNQTIADSNSLIAGDLRRHLRELLLEGASDEEILDNMVARYGDFIRYRPPLNPRTWLLWAAPAVFLLIGVGVAVVVVIRRSNLQTEDSQV